MRRYSISSVRASVRDIKVLPTPGYTEQKDVATTKQPDKQVVNDRFLAHDDLGELLADPQPRVAEPGDDRGVIARKRRAGGGLRVVGVWTRHVTRSLEYCGQGVAGFVAGSSTSNRNLV